MAKKNTKEITIRSSAAEYLTFIAATGDDKNSVEVRYEDENIWITQKMLAVLYEVETNTINYHIKKIFEDLELSEDSVIRNFRITASDGKSYDTKHYNLQMIIAVGFKVNSERAVQFRKWVNTIAKEYTIKGFAMDDERLKNDGSILTKKYFEEQLERIREIRSSERKFYQKITDIYATAIDYDLNAKSTQRFYPRISRRASPRRFQGSKTSSAYPWYGIRAATKAAKVWSFCADLLTSICPTSNIILPKFLQNTRTPPTTVSAPRKQSPLCMICSERRSLTREE